MPISKAMNLLKLQTVSEQINSRKIHGFFERAVEAIKFRNLKKNS